MGQRSGQKWCRLARIAAVGGLLTCASAVLAQVPAPPAGADHAPLVAPTTGRVVGVYGDCRDGCSRRHQGYDIEDAIGTPVYAAGAGTVDSVVRNRTCPSIDSTAGNQAAITHPGGAYRTVYLHLETVIVENGQHVVKGQQIGTMGNVGSLACIEPPHLHFEVRDAGVALDLNSTLPRGTRVVAGNPIPRHFGLSATGDIEIGDQSADLNGDGRLGVVTRATGGAVWYTSQTAAGGGSWSGWRSLGGITRSNPHLAANADARLQVFALGLDDAVWTTRQTAPGGSWSGWARVAGRPTAFIGDPVAVRRPDGPLDVFVRGASGAVWRSSQRTPGGADWTPWQLLGGIVTSDLAVAVDGAGGLEVFGRGSDGALWHNRQGQGGAWSGWVSLGGIINGGAAVGANPDGRLELFARGTNNALYHMPQLAAPGRWTGWLALGGVLRTDPEVARNQDGRLEVLAVGTDFSAWHTWQTSPGGQGWSGWALIGGRVGSTTEVHANAGGRLQTIVRADGRFGVGVFWAIQGTPGSSSWFGWGRL
jgi:hypothetical protein